MKRDMIDLTDSIILRCKLTRPEVAGLRRNEFVVACVTDIELDIERLSGEELAIVMGELESGDVPAVSQSCSSTLSLTVCGCSLLTRVVAICLAYAIYGRLHSGDYPDLVPYQD